MLIALAIAISLWLLLGRPKVATTRATLSVSEFYSGLQISLAVVAGLGGVIALVVAYRRQRIHEAQHGMAQAIDVREAAKFDGERFKSASEQLGSTEPAIRLAGAYAMMNLANSWEPGRQMCVDVLCGYLRMPFSISPTDGELAYSRIHFPKGNAHLEESGTPASRTSDDRMLQELQVRLAIQRTLAAHLRNPEREHEYDQEVLDFWPDIRLDLFGATLCNFDFLRCEVAWADFRRAEFLGDANFLGFTVLNEARFERASFFGGASFSRCAFQGGAVFVDARFRRNVWFAGTLFGLDGEFNRAAFEGAAVFDRSVFGGGAYFSDARFVGPAYFAKAKAANGFRLEGAEVRNEKAAHKWPAGFEIANGRLRRIERE